MALYVRQLRLGPMKNFVYLVGQTGAAEVAAVDPAWDVEAITRAAADDGKRIACAVVTHCHHDHVNGLPELLRRMDVPVYAQKQELEFDADLRAVGDAMKGVDPGDAIQIGPLPAKLLHTPGHTPGSHCLLTGDALLSGDTLFANHCGRCDLPGGNPEDMFRTIDQVLRRLPPETRLFPGHDYGDVPVSSIAREQEKNPYFQYRDPASFVAYRMRPRDD